jgi:hypothetical protein
VRAASAAKLFDELEDTEDLQVRDADIPLATAARIEM